MREPFDDDLDEPAPPLVILEVIEGVFGVRRLSHARSDDGGVKRIADLQPNPVGRLCEKLAARLPPLAELDRKLEQAQRTGTERREVDHVRKPAGTRFVEHHAIEAAQSRRSCADSASIRPTPRAKEMLR